MKKPRKEVSLQEFAYRDEFKKRFKELLRSNNLSQTDLAKAIGLSNSTVNNWLVSDSIIPVFYLYQMSMKLDISIDLNYLICGYIEEYNEKNKSIDYIALEPEEFYGKKQDEIISGEAHTIKRKYIDLLEKYNQLLEKQQREDEGTKKKRSA